MGLFGLFGRRDKNRGKAVAPNMVVVGGGARKSAVEAGDLGRVIAGGIRITPEVIKYLRYVAVVDEDVYGSVRDLQVLANPGFEINIISNRKLWKKRAKEALSDIDDIFSGRSLHTFINNQIFEIVSSGASSVEWVPTRARDGIRSAAVVKSETITIERRENGEYVFKQVVGGRELELDQRTYLYLPLQTVGDSPYGIPLIIAALRALGRKGKMITSVDRLLKLLGLAGIVHASVPVPEPERAGFEGETDPGYLDYISRKLTKVAELLTAGEEEGVFVTTQGTELDVVSAARDIRGAYTAWTDNQHLLWSGSRTLPFMRGRSESLSETWAKVAYPIILAEAGNIQTVIKRQVEFGLNLHLQLRGIPAKVSIEFGEPASPFGEANARTRLLDAQADSLILEMVGSDYSDYVRKKHGLGEAVGNGQRDNS